jgi:hypothetical protein
MDFLTKNKTTILGLVALIFVVWGYFTFFGGSSSAPLTAVPSDSAISGSLLTTLNSLHTIKLDNSFFSDPIFLSLSDFGTTLPEQPAGRGNPFAPVGAVSQPQSQPVSAPAAPTAPKTSTPPKSVGGSTSPSAPTPPTTPSTPTPGVPTPPPTH